MPQPYIVGRILAQKPPETCPNHSGITTWARNKPETCQNHKTNAVGEQKRPKTCPNCIVVDTCGPAKAKAKTKGHINKSLNQEQESQHHNKPNNKEVYQTVAHNVLGIQFCNCKGRKCPERLDKVGPGITVGNCHTGH